jgi:hypothetical protein
MERLVSFASSPPSTLCLKTPSSLRIPREVILEASKLSPPFMLYTPAGELNLHEVGRVYRICVERMLGGGLSVAPGIVGDVRMRSEEKGGEIERVSMELVRVEKEVGEVMRRIEEMDVPGVSEIDMKRYGVVSRVVVEKSEGVVIDAIVRVPGIRPKVNPEVIVPEVIVPKAIKKKVKTAAQMKSEEVNAKCVNWIDRGRNDQTDDAPKIPACSQEATRSTWKRGSGTGRVFQDAVRDTSDSDQE